MARIYLFFDFFFQLNFFCLLLYVSIHSASSLDSIITLILQEKVAKFELSHQKKVLDEYSSTLEFFFVNYVHILILIS